MAKHYSFVVRAPEDVCLPEEKLLLGRGMNAFNHMVENLDEFLRVLASAGVIVEQANPLGGGTCGPELPKLSV